jgi:cysteine desulfurase/selenocysteine lyase
VTREPLDAYVERVRRSFPFYRNPHTRDLAYLNSAAMALRPDAALEAVRPVMENPLTAGARAEEARHHLARRFGVDAGALYPVMGSHPALERVYRFLALRGPVRALLTPLEHKAVTNPLDLLERRGAARREILAVDAIGRVDPDDLAARLTPEISLVALTHVSNLNGTIQPLPEIRERIDRFNRENGTEVLLLVDGPQAVPRLAVDLTVADVYCFAQQKSFCLPGSFVYLSGRAKRVLTGEEDAERADRFLDEFLLAGTPHAEAIVSLAAALEFVDSLPPLEDGRGAGVGAAEGIVGGLKRILFQDLGSLSGVRILGASADRIDENAGIVLVKKAGVRAEAIGEAMERAGVVVRTGTRDRFEHYFCVPRAADFLAELEEDGGAVRISLAFYNDSRDLARALEVLERA